MQAGFRFRFDRFWFPRGISYHSCEGFPHGLSSADHCFTGQIPISADQSRREDLRWCPCMLLRPGQIPISAD